jgi:hypothetical protein
MTNLENIVSVRLGIRYIWPLKEDKAFGTPSMFLCWQSEATREPVSGDL